MKDGGLFVLHWIVVAAKTMLNNEKCSAYLIGHLNKYRSQGSDIPLLSSPIPIMKDLIKRKDKQDEEVYL